VRAAIYAALISAWELAAGVFLTYGAGRRLWDYSDSAVQFLGQVDLAHTLCWMLLSLFVERYLYPPSQRYLLAGAARASACRERGVSVLRTRRGPPLGRAPRNQAACRQVYR
jgi:uncharacterized membrane protein